MLPLPEEVPIRVQVVRAAACRVHAPLPVLPLVAVPLHRCALIQEITTTVTATIIAVGRRPLPLPPEVILLPAAVPVRVAAAIREVVAVLPVRVAVLPAEVAEDNRR